MSLAFVIGVERSGQILLKTPATETGRCKYITKPVARDDRPLGTIYTRAVIRASDNYPTRVGVFKLFREIACKKKCTQNRRSEPVTVWLETT